MHRVASRDAHLWIGLVIARLIFQSFFRDTSAHTVRDLAKGGGPVRRLSSFIFRLVLAACLRCTGRKWQSACTRMSLAPTLPSHHPYLFTRTNVFRLAIFCLRACILLSSFKVSKNMQESIIYSFFLFDICLINFHVNWHRIFFYTIKKYISIFSYWLPKLLLGYYT